MLTLIIRAVLVYLLVLLVFRLMGKRQIGQMQPFELVLTLVIADLATIPMSDIGVPVLHGIIPLITLVIVHFFLTFFSKKSPKISQFINGKPIVLIGPNGIDYQVLEKLKITIDDLLETIRNAGYFNLEEVQYAIMETNGTVNVLPKSQFAPVINQSLGLDVEEATLPVILVTEGTIISENLKNFEFDEKDIKKILNKAKISEIKNVLVLTIDKAGNVYIQEKDSKFQTFKIKVNGGENE